jgi:hypothetical protein
MTRVLDTHDVLLGLVPLIENPPWTRRLDTVSAVKSAADCVNAVPQLQCSVSGGVQACS